VTELIGGDHAVQRVRELLATGRLVTLTGPGGVGKTSGHCTLLPAAPGLRVLATSREPLRLRGEARWDLPPLDIPDSDDPARLARSSAVRLFLARAGLAPAPETAARVAEVCRRLDGIPLALELAATRVPALGVPELAARLQVPQDRFGLLRAGPRDAPARQRTLAAVIDWSWRLLTEPERAVLHRLAVHTGGCTLAAAEAVCAGDGAPAGEVLDLLAGLVDRSLVVRGDGPRFRLLERALDTCRAAGDRWGEAAALSTRAMLAHIRDDLAALEHDARRSAKLFGELGDDWGVLQATDWLIGLADLTGDQAEAARLSRAGLRIAEELGLWSDVAGRLAWLAWISVQVGDYPRAGEYAEQARRLAAEQGYRSGEVFATIGLAFAARRDGKLDPAEEYLRWLLASARQQQTGDGHPPSLSMVLVELGLLAGQRGDPAAALAWHREGFDVYRDQRSVRGMAWALAGMAAALVLDGRPGLAAQLLGAADAAWRKTGQPLSASDRDELARITAAVQAAEPDFAALFARGGKLSPGQARSLLDGDRA
jgi:tetratricopeptide (TPR) repeat protein